MLKDKFIICYSGTNWGLPWGICQRLMERLSGFNKIFFIEYEPSFLHCNLNMPSHRRYRREERGIFRKINDNLLVYSPKANLPFNNYFRAVNFLNQKKVASEVASRIKGRDPRRTLIWSFVPYAVDFIKRFDGFFSIYHCGANYAEEKKNSLRRRNILKMEREIAGCSDVIIGQTKSLCRNFDLPGKKTFYFPSAIDFDYFFKAVQKHTPAKNAEFKGIRHPRIGLVGYFDDRFYDIGLLEYLLDAKKDWSFVFVGPVMEKARGFNRLRRKPNAFFLGDKKPKEIPYYIRETDIGIIPYKVNDYTKTVSPTKFYEYLACGKPVVSTELPDIEGYADVLKTAKNKREFLGGIEHFLLKKTGETVEEKAFAIAKENSFGRYLENLSEIIERAINEERP